MIYPQNLEGVAHERMRDWEKEVEQRRLLAELPQELHRSRMVARGWLRAPLAKVMSTVESCVAVMTLIVRAAFVSRYRRVPLEVPPPGRPRTGKSMG